MTYPSDLLTVDTGFSSSAGFGIYCSTKFAVEGISEAMHAELAGLGIRVLIVWECTIKRMMKDEEFRRAMLDSGVRFILDGTADLWEL